MPVAAKTRATRTPAPRRERSTARQDDKARGEKSLQILAAAAKIFNERGYHGTSVADVADALGVSKPFLYYYLKNKDDILFECSRIATEQLHAMLDEVRKADVSGWKRLELIFHGYARVMTTDFGICLIRNTAPGSLPANSREKLWVGRRRLNREVEQIIAQGIADGSIRRCDPIALSFAIFGAFNWITYWYRENGPLSPHDISTRFLDIFALGVQAPALTAPSAAGGG
jgi:AcrR family transcriptional regulator